MLSEIWTLKTDGSDPDDEKTLAAWGFDSATLQRVSQAADVLTLSGPVGAATDDDLWAWEDAVTLYRDGVVFYRGRVALMPRDFSPVSERRRYEIRNVWWELERLTYLQEWNTFQSDGTLAAVDHSRVLLGWSQGTTDYVDSVSVLSALAAYSTAAGSAWTLDARVAGIDIPPLNLGTVSVAQAIREVMRWHPDCTLSARYSSMGTTLRLERAADGPALSVDVNGRPLSELRIHSRPDLQVDAVLLNYETYALATTLDGDDVAQVSARLVVAQDLYPAEATITRRSLVATLPAGPLPTPVDPDSEEPAEPAAAPVRPGSIKTHKQPIRTRVLPAAGATNLEAEKFWLWASRLDALGLDSDDIVLPSTSASGVKAHTVTLLDDRDGVEDDTPSAVNPNATPIYKPTTVGDLPRVLVQGALHDWMGVKGAPVLCEVTIGISTTAIAGLSPKDRDLFLGWRPRRGTVSATAAWLLDCSVELIGTDALNKVYEKLVAYDPGGVTSAPEAAAATAAAVAAAVADAKVPSLAQALYEARQALAYEGSVRLSAREAGATTYLGNALNLLHADRPEWSSMRAMVQAETLDLGPGAVTLSLGGPTHLAPQDAYELAQGLRRAAANRATPAPVDPEYATTVSQQGFSVPEENERSPVVAASIFPRHTVAYRPQTELRPWDLKVVTSGGATVIELVPGMLKESTDLDSDAALAITGLTGERSLPSAGDLLWVRFDFDTSTGAITGTTVELDSTWTGWPSPYKTATVSGELRLEKFYWALWSFHDLADCDLSDGTSIALSASIGARKLVQSAPFHRLVDVAVKDASSGQRFMAVEAVPSAGFAYEL